LAQSAGTSPGWSADWAAAGLKVAAAVLATTRAIDVRDDQAVCLSHWLGLVVSAMTEQDEQR
jgi:hypothetical protein